MDDEMESSSYDYEDVYEDEAPENNHIDNHMNMDRLPLVPTEFSSVNEALQNFAAVFESRYGGLHPRFQMTSLRDALDEAFGTNSKTPVMEQRPLAIYLHRDDGIGCNIFAQNVLCSEAIASLLNGQFVLWPWDMTQLDNRTKFFEWLVENNLVQVKDVARGASKDEYPMLILVTKDRTSLNVEEVIRGTDMTERVMEKLLTCLDAFQSIKNRSAVEEQNRLEREAIRQEQVDEYEKSKAIDKARQEELLRQRQREIDEQEEQMRALEAKQKRQAELASTIPSEPADSDPDTITIRLRFPSGEQKIRRFRMSEPVNWLVTYVESLGYDMETHRLWTADVPRKDVSSLDTSKTFAHIGWPRREQIIVDEK